MLLNRIHLNLRCKEARRDLSDPYQLHSTLCRAFCEPDRKCPQGEFLWRLEPETDPAGRPRILVQSPTIPNWTRINVTGWLANANLPVNLNDRLRLHSLKAGQRFRFRLRANPCVTRHGKRHGLFTLAGQKMWVEQKGNRHGFSLPCDIRISQPQMLRGKRHEGVEIHIFSVLYDGILEVVEPDSFRKTLLGGTNEGAMKIERVTMGIGHGRAMGLGLLSVVPIT